MLAFKHGELLAKTQVLQQQASASAEDAGEYPEPEPEQINHDDKVIAGRTLVPAPMLLISKPDGIVANNNLAQMVGTTRSRVSHFMNKFRILGFIDYAGSGVLTVNNCV